MATIASTNRHGTFRSLDPTNMDAFENNGGAIEALKCRKQHSAVVTLFLNLWSSDNDL